MRRSSVLSVLLAPGAGLLALGACAGAPDRTQVLTVAPGAAEKPFVSELLFASPALSAHRALVRDSVPLHVHDRHEETVYVIAGEGRMVLGERTIAIGPGSLVHVPRGEAHAVLATTPLSALSIFAPPFDGEDRRFLPDPAAR